MARRQRIDSATAAVAVMTRASDEVLPPEYEPLEDADMPYWWAVVRARAKADWTEENRVIAAKLARAMADEKRVVGEVRREQDVVINSKGTPVVNPKHALVEQLARRVMAWRKALALDARGSDGRASGIAARNTKARQIEADSPLDDDLLARPTVQ